MNINLHELANATGYGVAARSIKDAGAWDEYAGLPSREYRVRVEYSIRENCDEMVTVTARTKEEADELACKKIEDDCDYSVEIQDVFVLE